MQPKTLKKPKPNKQLEYWKKEVRKNKLGFGVLAGVVVFFVYILLFAEPRAAELTQLEENTKLHWADWAKQTKAQVQLLNGEAKAYGDLNSWYNGLSAFQRSVVIQESVKACTDKEGELPKLFSKISVPNMLGLFGSAVPDVARLHAEFSKEGANLANLLAAVQAGNDRSTMSEEALEFFEDNQNFWGGMEIFSEAEQAQFKKTSWEGARSLMLPAFIRTTYATIATKKAQEEAGELDWPEEPAPELSWAEEGGVGVVHVDEDDDALFDQTVAATLHALVVFYAPWCGHCKKLKPELAAVAAYTQDSDLAVIGVDCTVNKGLAKRYDIKGYPTIKYFKGGQLVDADFTARTAYETLVWLNDESRLNGELTDLVESIKPAPELSWADEGALHVVHADDTSLDAALSAKKYALVMFYAPWCGHCKSFKPAFAAAAAQLQGEPVSLVGVDATISNAAASRFEVKGYPTILFFADGQLVRAFDGARTTQGIMDFLSDFIGEDKEEL